jgi:hypothetical protein
MNQRLYNIQSHPEYGFYTGILANQHQALMSEDVLIEFDTEGNHVQTTYRELPERLWMVGVLKALNEMPADTAIVQKDNHVSLVEWQVQIGFVSRTISVKKFFLSESCTGIDDLPGEYLDFLENPEAFDEEEQEYLPEEIQGWEESRDFVFYWGNDYYMNEAGEVHSS